MSRYFYLNHIHFSYVFTFFFFLFSTGTFFLTAIRLLQYITTIHCSASLVNMEERLQLALCVTLHLQYVFSLIVIKYDLI